MKTTLLCAALAACTFAIPSASRAASTTYTIERADLAVRLVETWAPRAADALGIDPKTWAAEMAPAFRQATLVDLRRAAEATDVASVHAALLSSEIEAKALGDAARDLVFVPVAPCRILDTRIAGGAIAANTSRNFNITAIANYSGQGGANTDCGVGSAGEFAAAMINFTVVTPSGAGYITAYPMGAAQPLAATVNYTAGAIVGNMGVVRLAPNPTGNDMSVYSFAQTHLVGDIVGYFVRPQATALQCVQVVSASTSVPANGSVSVVSGSCPATYTITGGGCVASDTSTFVVSFSTHELANEQRCTFRSTTAAGALAEARARCCRTPGS